MAEDRYTPRPEHKFSFGLWTVGNRRPDEAIKRLREALSLVLAGKFGSGLTT